MAVYPNVFLPPAVEFLLPIYVREAPPYFMSLPQPSLQDEFNLEEEEFINFIIEQEEFNLDEEFFDFILDEDDKFNLEEEEFNLEEVDYPKVKWCKWEPPAEGTLCLNCDGSFRGPVGGSGFIIRDHAGDVISAGAVAEEGSSPLIHELRGISLGLRQALKLGIKKLIVRSDSQVSISYVKSQSGCPQWLQSIVTEIKELTSCFLDITFEWVYRECNRAADFLSKLIRIAGDSTLCEKLPEDLLRIIDDDKSGNLVPRLLR